MGLDKDRSLISPNMNLDDSAVYQQLDPSGMYHRIAALPQQCRRAWEQASALKLPEGYRGVKEVVIAGMGGSAVGGDLIADLVGLEDSPVIVTVRDYILPSWVGPQTLVIASSYSGETEETLAVFQEALRRQARAIALTGGGGLKALAESQGLPVLEVDFDGEPRSALGYSFIAPLAILCGLGLIKHKSPDLEAALRSLDLSWGRDVPTGENAAKLLAAELQGCIPVVYGGGVLTGVARRWKSQLNENAKSWAFAEVLPELNHNSVVGYGWPSAIRERLFVVLLRSSYSHPRTNLRYDATMELLRKEGIGYRLLEAAGPNPLAHLLNALMLGDFTSYYLAMLNGVDPSLVVAIDFLKGKLADLG